MNLMVMENLLKKLDIPPTLDTPRVEFNPKDGVLIIEGKSFPPDVASFYQKVTNWLEEYVQSPAKKTLLSLKLDYFNTASSKIILDILYKFESMHLKGHEVNIKWYYPDDDDDMKETGEEYEQIVDVTFEHIEYSA